MKSILLTILFFVSAFQTHNLRAQYFDLGQEPASIKWYQIKTEHFKILFSKDFAEQAERIAKLLEQYRQYSLNSIGYKPGKTTVIIHNRSVISNAYAAWAPARMEFFTTSPQSVYGQDWLEQLCLHEYRHIAQMGKMKTATGKYLYIIFGQQSTAVLFGLFIPSWFMEGDAIFTETAFSKAGRGRVPEFTMPLKAQIGEKGLYSFDKAAFGSFKDYVPNEYAFGYLFVAAARMKYGPDLWNNATSFVAKAPHSLTPLSTGLKKQTGYSLRKLYKSSFHYLDSVLKFHLITDSACNHLQLSPVNNIYTSYEQPVFINDSLISAVKFGLADERQFVLLNYSAEEKKIFTPGFFNPVRLSSNGEGVIFSHNKNVEEILYSSDGKYIVWAEVKYDKRWAHRTWSVVKKLDIKTGKVITLTKRSKYFAPSISPDGNHIAVSEILPDYKHSLVIIDAFTGEESRRLILPDNELILAPSWAPDSKTIYCVTMNMRGEKGLLSFNCSNNHYSYLIGPSNSEINKPVSDGRNLFFNASYQGKPDIYSLNLKTNKRYKVSKSKFGASGATISPDGKRIAYADYTENGYRIIAVEYDTSKWEEVSAELKPYYFPADVVSLQEKVLLPNDSILNKEFKVKRYRKGLNLFHVHSWMPFAYDELPGEILPGLTLMSQDKLSNAFLTAGYGYNISEKTSSLHGSFIYKAWYPVIELSHSYGGRCSYFNDFNSVNNIEYNWDEAVTKLSLGLPLNFTHGRWFRHVNIYTGIENINLSHQVAEPEFLFNGNMQTFVAGTVIRNFCKSSVRDLRPKWGQVLSFDYITSLTDGLEGGQKVFKSAFLFPGLFKHHSFRLAYGLSHSECTKYSFPGMGILPRGYLPRADSEIEKASVDYRFPLLYPDFNAWGIVYIKRLKSNLFLDYAEGINKTGSKNIYKSFGAECTFDVVPFRAMLPIDIGFRYIYLPGTSENKIEFMMSVNFDSF